MLLLAGRTQDLADVEAIIESGAGREPLRSAVQNAPPGCVEALDRLVGNIDRAG
jgi:hypothetical protein